MSNNKSNGPPDLDELCKEDQELFEPDFELPALKKKGLSVQPNHKKTSFRDDKGVMLLGKALAKKLTIKYSFQAKPDVSQFIEEQKEMMIEQTAGSVTSEATPIKPLEPAVKDDWMASKAELLELDEQEGHAYFLADLAYKEKIVEKKLDKLRKDLFEKDPIVVTGKYWDKLHNLFDHPLYDCLKMMPKPAVHHSHLTGSPFIPQLVKFTYNDFVYYSQKENNFIVDKNGCTKDSYMKVNKLRQYANDAQKFDDELADLMLLKPTVPEDHGVWAGFQPKFSLTNQLVNYAEFYERIVFHVCKKHIKELVTIVEFRIIPGMLFDEDGVLDMEREFAIYYRVMDFLKPRFPLFQIKLIISSLKFMGTKHCKEMCDAMIKCKDRIPQLIVGFDMVCEEDYNPKTDEFLETILSAKQELGDKFHLIMHAGESTSSFNKELYDAILLGTKRIGHGFALARHPKLIDIVKEKNICIECCPISNNVLGYVHDLRCHPTRGLLQQGVKVSISPDDQGFWDSRGVTLDYLAVYLAWDLNLSDLKQLVFNSLEFASISEEEKKAVRDFNQYKWVKFLAYVRGRY